MNAASPEMTLAIWPDYLEHWLSFTRWKISSRTIERACDMAWQYKLRGYDSIHLASALPWQETIQTPIVFATLDRDLWTAGRKAGMDVWPEGLVLDV